jgi:hypothetical protein
MKNHKTSHNSPAAYAKEPKKIPVARKSANADFRGSTTVAPPKRATA